MEKQDQSSIQDKKNSRTITTIAIAAFVLLIFFFLMFTETVALGRIQIQNDTDLDISRIRIFFDNTNSEYYALLGEETFRSEDLWDASIHAGEEKDGKFSTVSMNQKDAELCVDLEINGEAVAYYSGNFQDDFKGRIRVHLYTEDGESFIRIKAESGVFLFTKTKLDVTYKL